MTVIGYDVPPFTVASLARNWNRKLFMRCYKGSLVVAFKTSFIAVVEMPVFNHGVVKTTLFLL